MDEHIHDMLNQGIIQPSVSPFSAPLLLIDKRSYDVSSKREKRLVVDFRRLNASTVPQRFSIPLMQETVLNIGKAKIFSSLDLASGYWQMMVDEESRPYTAFSTSRGHWEFLRMPFGVKNGPSAFSKLMTIVLSELLGSEVLVYLDDLIVYSETESQHFERLGHVFERLRQANLKIKIRKCNFFPRKACLFRLLTVFWWN